MTSGNGLRRFVPSTGPPPAPPDRAGARPDRAGAPPAADAAAGPAGPAGLPPDAGALAKAFAANADRFALAPPGPAAAPEAPETEKCELCGTDVPGRHGHVADLESASLICACRACYLLFTHPQAGRGRYRAVPDRYLRDSGRVIPPARWEQFEIPVGLAFFLRSSQRGQVTGFYPSPAGATEAILDLAAWDQLTADFPLLAAAEPDVEAVLVSKADAGVEYFLVPVDVCYELAGRMRLTWRGFDGGTEARAAIEDFLAGVRARARPFGEG